MNIYLAIAIRIIIFAIIIFCIYKISKKNNRVIFTAKKELNELIQQQQLLKKEIENLQTIQEDNEKLFSLKQYQLETEYKNKLEQEKDDYNKEYLDILKTNIDYFKTQTDTKRLELEDLLIRYDDIKSKVNSAVESYKKATADKIKQQFYMLDISAIDKKEISKIREIETYLRDSRPLNKVIWAVYYERPLSDLVGRVVGNDIVCGIYKLTNMENGMCYVGQAVNIADRWRTHVKCGLGADTAPSNKLYNAMREYGPETFMFEIVEKCDKEMLNEREQFWQDFFKAKEFGYSMK